MARKISLPGVNMPISLADYEEDDKPRAVRDEAEYRARLAAYRAATKLPELPAPENVANALLAQYELPSPPLDVFALAALMGFTVVFKRLPNNPGLYDGDRDRPIELDGAAQKGRQRYILAFQLGCARFEAIITQAMLGKKDYFRSKEKWSKVFAGCLLMPRVQMLEYWNGKNPPWRLAQIFQVSEAAVVIRLKVLKLVRRRDGLWS